MATVAFFAIVLCFAPVAHPQGKGPPAGPLAELQAQIDDLQARVETLEGADLVALQARVDALEELVDVQAEGLAAFQDRVDAVEALTQFQIVVPGEINGLAGPHLIFEGVNLHIESGSGSTTDGGSPIGLGNLVVGYNEVPSGGLVAGDRDGSHNIVLGPEHKYLSTGGFVAGFRNTISGFFASVSGGFGNTASGRESSVSGGRDNLASSSRSSVSGGQDNTAGPGSSSSVSGGDGNTASGFASSVSGGQSNTANGNRSSVSGGQSNAANGNRSSVSGGAFRTALSLRNWVAGGLFEPN